MPLPVLARTWQFQVNTNTGAPGTPLGCNQALLYTLKEALRGNGAWTDSAGGAVASASNWSVSYSCDSVNVGSPGDGVDYWAAPGNLIWNGGALGRSWIVLRQPGIAAGFELCIFLNSGSPQVATVVVSPGAGFTGGTTTTRPIAADEIVLLNANNYGGPSINVTSLLHVLKTADGTAARIAICRNGQVAGYWTFERPGNPIDGWTDPSVSVALVGDAGGAPTTICTLANLSNAAQTWGYNQNPIAHYLTGLCTRAHSMLANNQTVANDIGAEYPFYQQGIYSETVYGRGRNGKVVDQWWGLAALADSDTYPVGSNDFVQLGDIIWPWNTSAPNFGGGVSTARAGTLAAQGELWFEDYLPPTAGTPDAATTSAGATTYYLMQALDSVTTVRYDWVVQDTPDWSGAGYPGPNAPTDIAIAGRRVS